MYKSRLPEIAAELLPRLEVAAAEAAGIIEQAAKARVPVDTGKLRNAIHVEQDDGGFAVVAGDSDVFYGHIVEHGGNNTAARPFMIPALEESRGAIQKLAKTAMRGL